MVDLRLEGGAVAGVVLADGHGTVIGARVVLTAGTFLNGVIHIGDQRHAGRPDGRCAVGAAGERSWRSLACRSGG